MMRNVVLAAGLLLASVLAAPAQEADFAATLTTLLGENRTLIDRVDGELSGPGLELLVEEGRAAEFFLVGERHHTAEIPHLSRRLALALRPAGYEAVAVESGPQITTRIVDMLERGGILALQEELGPYPYTVAFLDRREEAAMLVSLLDAGYEVWGLDQEFIGAGRYWLDALEGLAGSGGPRELVASWQAREAEAVRHFLQTRQSDRAMLMVATAEDFALLRKAFAGQEEATRIVDALATSAHIYQLWRSQNYRNNHDRVAYLKDNLLGRMERAGGILGTKVFLKFGSVHMGRGRTPTNQYDLGNLAHELAVARGGHSLHLLAIGPVREEEDRPGYRLLQEQVDLAASWTVFDLRALRPFFHRASRREAAPELGELVFRYDFLAFTPRPGQSEALFELPGG